MSTSCNNHQADVKMRYERQERERAGTKRATRASPVP